MSPLVAAWLWAATWAAEVLVRAWHLWPRRQPLFA